MNLILGDGIPFREISELRATVPLANDITMPQIKACFCRIKAANQLMPQVRDFFYTHVDNNRESFLTNPIEFIDELLTDERIPERLYIGKREYQIAVAAIAFRFLATAFKLLERPEKLKVYADLLYVGAIHELLVGIKTNISLFLSYPEETDLSILSEIGCILGTDDDEKAKLLAVRYMFEGGGVSQPIPLREDGIAIILN